MNSIYYKKQTGNIGEDIATDFLIKSNYKIVQRNFNCWWGEIDIIALDKKELVFIEVKTRKNKKYGLPAEAITHYKKKHLLKTVEYYLLLNNLFNSFIRIDVIEVYLNTKNHTKVNHIKNAISQ